MSLNGNTAEGYRNLMALGFWAIKGTLQPRVGCGHLVAAGRWAWADENGGLCAECAWPSPPHDDQGRALVVAEGEQQ